MPGLPIASAVLTKFKGEGDEKATLRPYTPINDESTLPSRRQQLTLVNLC